jgi:hypothetical protein
MAWNRSAVIDMLGSPETPSFNTHIVQDVLQLLMFPNKGTVSVENLQSLLQVLSVSGPSVMNSISSSNVDAIGEEHLSSQPSSPSDIVHHQEIADTEKYLWSMLGLTDEFAILSTPSRAAIGHCLRLYRKLLVDHNWKARDVSGKNSEIYSFMQFVGIGNIFARQSNELNAKVSNTFALDSELEELFCCVNLLSLVCKTLLLSYSSFAKQQHSLIIAQDSPKYFSYQRLMYKLPVGVKSDFANLILESLNSFTAIWKLRFQPILLETLRKCDLFENVTTFSGLPANSQSWEELSQVKEPNRALTAVHKRFLLQLNPVIPGFALFRVLCKELVLPVSLKEYVDRMYS